MERDRHHGQEVLRAVSRRGASSLQSASLREELRFQKVYKEIVPMAIQLDDRATYPLSRVNDPRELIQTAKTHAAAYPYDGTESQFKNMYRSGSRVSRGADTERSEEVIPRTPATPLGEEEDGEDLVSAVEELVPKGFMSGLEARLNEMGPKRDPSKVNLLLRRNDELCAYAGALSETERSLLAEKVKARLEKTKEALLTTYRDRLQRMNRRGLFCKAANRKRARTMLQVELRRIRPDTLEIDVLDEMCHGASSSDGIKADISALLSSKRASTAYLSRITRSSIDTNEGTVDDRVAYQDAQSTLSMALRTRALGRATARMKIELRRPRQYRPLGQFMSDEDAQSRGGSHRSRRTSGRERKKGRSGAASTTISSKSATSSRLMYGETDEEQRLSSANEGTEKVIKRNVDAQQNERKFYLTQGNKKSDGELDMKSLERVWGLLEYPAQDRFDLLCKYSTEKHALVFRPMVRALERFADMFAMRKCVLDKMRDVQENPKHRLKWESIFTAREFAYLERIGCSIDTVDFFGVSSFLRLAHIAKNLSRKCSKDLVTIRDRFGDVVTYRGEECDRLLREDAEIEGKWTKRADWRRVLIPPKVPYTKNPILRRMGDAVV